MLSLVGGSMAFCRKEPMVPVENNVGQQQQQQQQQK
jgi:hypothetical protein